MGAGNVGEGKYFASVLLSNHYSVHLKLIQNDIECKLSFKNKI